MALFNFFKLSKNRQFTYNPLFYDKQKEEFEQRVRSIEQEMGIHKDAEFKSSLKRGAMRSYLQTSRKKDKYSSLRLILILVILLALAYYLLMM